VDSLRDPELEERRAMIRQQLIPRGISDRRLLFSMEAVQRRPFVPPALAEQAYADQPLAIGFGQTIWQPYLVALALQALELEGHEHVLEVGTGSGYQAALLGLLSFKVRTIEVVPELSERARATLSELGFEKVHVAAGDGTFGDPVAAPFDAIVVTAASERVPAALLAQLAPGGRLVMPVGGPAGQALLRLTKHPQGVEREVLGACSVAPLASSLCPPRRVRRWDAAQHAGLVTRAGQGR
jgi:protein-L-isoaspartate(D-aspartate) O-methyltransferase